MGERIALGVVAVLVACGLSGAAAPVQAAPTLEAAPVAPSEWQPTYGIDPNLADKLIAETPRGSAPDNRAAVWNCKLPITLDYAVAPGVDIDNLRDQMAYPVRYLQGLGYYAAIGTEVPYTPNMQLPSTPGTVVVVVAWDRTEQPGLAYGPHRAAALRGSFTPGATAVGRISVMATNGMSSDVLLHEAGHILGLEHKDGTVMAEAEDSTLGFDAAETAAIDCR